MVSSSNVYMATNDRVYLWTALNAPYRGRNAYEWANATNEAADVIQLTEALADVCSGPPRWGWAVAPISPRTLDEC